MIKYTFCYGITRHKKIRFICKPDFYKNNLKKNYCTIISSTNSQAGLPSPGAPSGILFTACATTFT